MPFDPPAVPGAAARQLHPKVRTLWLVGGIVSDAVAIAVLTGIAAVVVANTQLDLDPWALVVAPVVWLLSIPLRLWYTSAAYRAWSYRFTTEGLELRHGVFWRRASAMPYHRLQQVDVGQGPLERWLGMSSVQLRSAAATTDATIPGIATDDVDELRRMLMERAGRDAGT